MAQPDGALVGVETHNHLVEKEISLNEDEYEKEGSSGSCRLLVIVRERRPQKVVQEGLEDLWVIHTS